MSFEYNYTYANLQAPFELQTFISESSIGANIDFLNYFPTTDNLDIYFTIALTTGEEASLGTLLTEYVNDPLVQPVEELDQTGGVIVTYGSILATNHIHIAGTAGASGIGDTTGALHIEGGGSINENWIVGCDLCVGKDFKVELNATIPNLIVTNLSVGSIAGSGDDLECDYVEDLTETCTTSTGYRNKINHTTTALEGGEYLIGVHYRMRNYTDKQPYRTRLLIDGTEVHSVRAANDNGADFVHWSDGFKRTLTAGTHVYKLQYRYDGTISNEEVSINDAKIYTIKIGD